MMYFVVTSIGFAICYVLYIFFLKKEKALYFNRFFILASIGACLFAPFIEFPKEITIALPDTFIAPVVQQFSLTEPSAAIVESVHQDEVNTSARTHTIWSFVWWGYLVITGFLLFRYVLNLGFLFFRIKRAEVVFHEGLKIVLTDEKTTPYSFFSNIFINTSDWENHRISSSVLQHEKAHAQQLHALDLLIIEFLKCFFWFQPMLWFFHKKLQENHEFLADDYVLKHGEDTDCYAQTLIAYGNGNNTAAFVHGFSFLLTQNRIDMMYKTKKMKLLRKLALFTMLLGVFLSLSAFSNYQNMDPFVVVIDPGHGGRDPGYGSESILNMQIAEKIAALSKEKGEVKIVLTRDGDKFISLADRVALTKEKKADLFISLHCNASKNTAEDGMVVFYSDEVKHARDMGMLLLINWLDTFSGGGAVESANFYVLRNQKIPSVMVEMGFLTNPKSIEKLANPNYQQKIAENIYGSILRMKTRL